MYNEFLQSNRPKYLELSIFNKETMETLHDYEVIIAKPCKDDDELIAEGYWQLQKDIEQGILSPRWIYSGFGDVIDRDGTGRAYMIQLPLSGRLF